MPRIKPSLKTDVVPFAFHRVYSFGPPEECIAALQIGKGFFYIEHTVGLGHLALNYVEASAFGGLQYKNAELDVGSVAKALKAKALTHGATLEAIQLLGVVTPLTNEEELQMAEAGTKLSRKSANKEELKAAAKGASVAGKTEKAPRDMSKLREAKAAKESAGPDKRKVTIADEHKKGNPFREGSGRADAFEHMKKAKTVQDYLDAGGPAKYVKKFADMGHVTIG